MATTVQNFKGDAKELKMQAVVNPLLDLTNASLDDFYAGAANCSAFLLMLYDEKRMPFSERVPRASFIDFITLALANFPVIGTFESYLFILKSIFGDDTEIRFTVPAPGKLSIEVDAVASSRFEFIGREFVDGAYTYFNMGDDDGNDFIFRGIVGIDTEYGLRLLFSEIMPAGVIPTITLEFDDISDWVDDDGETLMSDELDEGIIFIEGGG